MHRDIEIALVRVVEVHNAVQVLVLRLRNIVVVGRHIDTAGAQLVRNMLDNAARFIDFIDHAGCAANVFAMA
jgi:hypothetical protein